MRRPFLAGTQSRKLTVATTAALGALVLLGSASAGCRSKAATADAGTANVTIPATAASGANAANSAHAPNTANDSRAVNAANTLHPPASSGAAGPTAIAARPASDGGAAPTPKDARRGLYRKVRDQAHFTECGAPARTYEVRDADGALGQRAQELTQYGGEAVYVELRGDVDAKARSSAGVDVLGVLSVGEVFRVERKSAATTCLRFDYWLHGVEPAWTAQVSEAEGLIDFHHEDAHKSWHFDFVRPTLGEGGTEWKASDPVWKTELAVRVHKAQCTDGTDRRYDYRATVTLGKAIYKGCAQPWK